jgi:glycosyltransferase involved in cell wall biosynthesis
LADLDVQVLLAGGPMPGLESYAEQLLSSARERLGPRFRFLGWLKTPQLQELFNALDLYVNTSAEESFGLSVLESLACGCPVVGYPSVSVSEVVLPDGGQIVPQNDINALATAVREWLTDPERLAAARPLARRQAQRFDIAEISQQLWKEYQDVLAEHRASRRSRFSLVGRG